LKSTPAYQSYIAEGKGKFGVKGKTYNEVQSEVARLRRFINSETSTVRGASSVLKEMAANTGIKYKNLKELKAKSSRFFELSSKVEQYLRTVDDMASAIGYQKIWEAVNQYVKDSNINLDQGGDNLDGMVKAITGALKEYDEPVPLWANTGWYSLK
jgi:methyl-accepting chemotaxis protein